MKNINFSPDFVFPVGIKKAGETGESYCKSVIFFSGQIKKIVKMRPFIQSFSEISIYHIIIDLFG